MTTLYMESVAIASDIRALLPPIMRRDQDLARRLKRASDEAPEHLAESMCLTGRAKRVHLAAAQAAVKEVLACVRAAVSVGHLKVHDPALEARIDQLARRIGDPSAVQFAQGA